MTIKEIAQISGLKESQASDTSKYLSKHNRVIKHRIIEEHTKAGEPPRIYVEIELNPKKLLSIKKILEFSESQGES